MVMIGKNSVNFMLSRQLCIIDIIGVCVFFEIISSRSDLTSEKSENFAHTHTHIENN